MEKKFTTNLDFSNEKEALFTIKVNTDEGVIVAKGQYLYKKKATLRVRWVDGKKHDIDEELKEKIKDECMKKALGALF